MQATPIIEVKDLVRDYETKKGWIRPKREIIHAVRGISFSVGQGEIFGLLGQNGAGKTTTIKTLITMLAPTSGSCRVFGFDTFGEEKKIRGRINFIFGGELGVYRRLTARDNLKYFANLYKVPSGLRDKRIADILELVGLSDKADLRTETYSKGMIQRVQIARGLINDPEIIFMDEPTVGLDPVGAQMLRDIIKTVRAEGKTVLLTTHNMYEADELCDRLAVMKEGRIIIEDTPMAIKEKMARDPAIVAQVEKAKAEQAEKISQISLEAAYIQLVTGDNE